MSDKDFTDDEIAAMRDGLRNAAVAAGVYALRAEDSRAAQWAFQVAASYEQRARTLGHEAMGFLITVAEANEALEAALKPATDAVLSALARFRAKEEPKP